MVATLPDFNLVSLEPSLFEEPASERMSRATGLGIRPSLIIFGARRTHQFPRHVRIVGKDLNREFSILVEKQPVQFLEAGGRHSIEVVTKALEECHVLPGIYRIEGLEEIRHIGRLVPLQVECCR